MKTYSVRVPFTGVMDIEVEAENEEAAINQALDSVNIDHVAEWEAHRQIVRGNVFYGHTNEAEATEID